MSSSLYHSTAIYQYPKTVITSATVCNLASVSFFTMAGGNLTPNALKEFSQFFR